MEEMEDVKERENLTKNQKDGEQESDNSTLTPLEELVRVAQEVENATNVLDNSVEHFATFFEENRAEVSGVIESIERFANKVKDLEKVLENIEELVRVFGDFSEKISDIADDITVLSINSSVEIRKENIDRNALRKISEMIMQLAGNVRDISKNTKKHVKKSKEIAGELTNNIEVVVEEVKQVHETLKTLENLNLSSLKNLELLVDISKNSRKTVEQLLKTVDVLKEKVEEIRRTIIQLLD
ncbi:methyl-accepting chemotaxis protein [Fervidobacterium thailandense]|uniref:Methyl-accepting transducer domain-containing protein n=1 Tax=Fervidobacterium thailandense TaxID=1008305 RepID=A0A1E3G1H7_9BACT|nr:methyl-accepting chemotaxis protein [Fervidobacterium thailandense]ODN30095.1 hypothetical protein A4H02_07265 [Fervidobacterium thailandense]